MQNDDSEIARKQQRQNLAVSVANEAFKELCDTNHFMDHGDHEVLKKILISQINTAPDLGTLRRICHLLGNKTSASKNNP